MDLRQFPKFATFAVNSLELDFQEKFFESN